MLSVEEHLERDRAAREQGRARSRRAAASGRGPTETYDPESLAFIFKGHEHEIAELDAMAATAVDRRRRSEDAAERRRMVHRKADEIEKEWAAQARAAALAEAERRIARLLGDAVDREAA